MNETNIKIVQKDLEVVKRLVIEMKEQMDDCFLTAEEEIEVEKARKEFRNRETISLEDIKIRRKNVQN